MGVGNRLDMRKGKVKGASGRECIDKTQGGQRFRSALLRCELIQDGARGFGIGIGCSGVILMTQE